MTEDSHPSIPARNAYRMTSQPAGPPEQTTSGPILSTTLCIRPLWRIAPPGFRDAWEAIVSNALSKSRNPFLEKRVLSDQSVLFAARGISRSIRKARNILQAFRNGWKSDRIPFVPVQAVVDAGSDFTIGGEETREPDIPWAALEPGEIYFTLSAYHRCREKGGPAFEPHPSGRFFRLMDNGRARIPGGAAFRYGAALGQGPHRPCFYCGLGAHAAMNCPSKRMDGRRSGLESLGYCSPSGLNALFLGYLLGERGEFARSQSSPVAVSYDTAIDGVMDLLYIHQLRFFAQLWGAEVERWDKVGTARSGKPRRKGGFAWLAFDCLRSSNHLQAAEVIEKALDSTPHDFWLHCIQGYLLVEQGAPDPAADAFGRALGYAATTPQRIFAHFLIFRIRMMEDRIVEAEKHLEEILALEPRCLDAVYQSAVLCLRRQETEPALEKIAVLVQDDRRMFVRALIAPELSPFHRVIGRKLGLLHDQAREAAEAEARAARAELERMKAILGEKDRVVVELASLWSKTEALLVSESYFGYLDACHSASAVAARTRREIRKRQDHIYQMLAELDERCLALFDTLKTLPEDSRARPLHAELKWIRGEMDAVRKEVRHEDAGAFQKASATCREISERIQKARAKIEMLTNLWIVRSFLLTFSRINLIFQPINLLIGIVLLPLAVRYLLPGQMGADVPMEQIRLFQAGAIFLGGATGVLYAIVKCLDRPAPGGTGS